MSEHYFQPFLYRLKEHCIQATTDKGELSFRSDVKTYYDPLLFANEIAWLQTMPVALGTLNSLTKPGDYFSCNIFNNPLIATRTTQDEIRIYANICKHRAATLLSQTSGNISTITCPYHGWRYSLDGELIHCPSQHLAAPHLKLNNIHLTHYPTYTAANLLWTQPSDRPSSQWSEFIAPLTHDFQTLWNEEHKPVAQLSFLCEFNWKIAVESFLEIYHFAHLHKKSIPDLRYPNIALMDKLGPHARIIIPMNSFIEQLEQKPESDWTLLPHCNIMYYIFPCNFLLIMRGFYAWITITPIAVDRTRIQLTILAPEHGDAELIQRAQLSAQGLGKILSEDIAICNDLQKKYPDK